MLFPFDGHAPPKSNWTWVPPEFFDVVLGARASLHEARALAYLLRRARGQETEAWLPQAAELQVSYGDFVRGGVPRSRVRATLDAMEAAGFITLVSAGCTGASSQAGVYQLRWSSHAEPRTGPCGTTLPDGFCGAIQKQIAVPNTFLDATMRECSLRVIQIVAVFMLRCLGYSAADGIRRREVSLSHTEIQRLTGMTRRNVQHAIGEACEVRQIQILVKPHYRTSRPAIYGLCWQDGWGTPDVWPGPDGFGSIGSGNAGRDDTSKPGHDDSSKAQSPTESTACTGVHIMHPGAEIGAGGSTDQTRGVVQNRRGGSSDQTRGLVQSRRRGGSDQTRGGSTEPTPGGSSDQTPLAIALKAQEQKPLQQQQAVVVEGGSAGKAGPRPAHADELLYRLTDAGVDRRTADELVDECDLQVIRDQLDFHPHRGYARNPAGRLVVSIRQNWAAPQTHNADRPGDQSSAETSGELVAFARGIYAGLAGIHPEQSVAEPDTLDLRCVNRFVKAIPGRFARLQRSTADFGFALGHWIADQQRREYGKVRLGGTAARLVNGYGDAFMAANGPGSAALRQAFALLDRLSGSSNKAVAVEGLDGDTGPVPVQPGASAPTRAVDAKEAGSLDDALTRLSDALEAFVADPAPPAGLHDTLRKLPWWPAQSTAGDVATLAWHLTAARCNREIGALVAHYGNA